MSKHTPGPWEYWPGMIVDAERQILAYMAFGEESPISDEEADANGYLMAAALELKELLCEALYYVDEHADMWMNKDADELSDRIRACLSKIEGGDAE